MQKSLFRLAQISDLHFARPTYSPSQFFSKRWLGNLNLLLSRKQNFITSRLLGLVDYFKELEVDYVVITGDLTTTSLKEEFAAAATFVKHLQEAGMKVFTVPGNHDQYTKKAFKENLFYQFFTPSYSQEKDPIYHYSLKEHGVAAAPLSDRWWFVGIDTALATSLVSSRGLFSEHVEKHLLELLSLIPPMHQVIAANHFPFFQHESQRKTLKRGEALKTLISRFPNITFFLHGHTHRSCIADLRGNHLPIILDSGSTSHREDGGFNLIDVKTSGASVTFFRGCDALWSSSRLASFLW